MALADLLVIIIDVIVSKLNFLNLYSSFLWLSPLCNGLKVISSTVVASSVWLTVAFTFDRMVAICFQKLKMKYCTEKTAAIVIATVSVLSLLTNIPVFFRYVVYNFNMYCIEAGGFFSLVWIVFDWTDRILTPVLPFVLILLLNTLTVRHILLAIVVRRKLRGQRNGEEQNDPEMKNRRRSIILLFTISGSFILLWMTRVIIEQANEVHASRSEGISGEYGVVKNAVNGVYELVPEANRQKFQNIGNQPGQNYIEFER
ncbi:uncharacterized protein LOC144487536, partial [Mustelus asterias]